MSSAGDYLALALSLELAKTVGRIESQRSSNSSAPLPPSTWTTEPPEWLMSMGWTYYGQAIEEARSPWHDRPDLSGRVGAALRRALAFGAMALLRYGQLEARVGAGDVERLLLSAQLYQKAQGRAPEGHLAIAADSPAESLLGDIRRYLGAADRQGLLARLEQLRAAENELGDLREGLGLSRGQTLPPARVELESLKRELENLRGQLKRAEAAAKPGAILAAAEAAQEELAKVRRALKPAESESLEKAAWRHEETRRYAESWRPILLELIELYKGPTGGFPELPSLVRSTMAARAEAEERNSNLRKVWDQVSEALGLGSAAPTSDTLLEAIESLKRRADSSELRRFLEELIRTLGLDASLTWDELLDDARDLASDASAWRRESREGRAQPASSEEAELAERLLEALRELWGAVDASGLVGRLVTLRAAIERAAPGRPMPNGLEGSPLATAAIRAAGEYTAARSRARAALEPAGYPGPSEEEPEDEEDSGE